MQFNERLKIRFGMSAEQVAKRFGLSVTKLEQLHATKPEMIEFAFKGLDVGSKWVDFQDKLESQGLILIERDGSVKYDTKMTDLAKFCRIYGIGAVSDLVELTKISFPTLKTWGSTRKNLLQYVLFGVSYHCRFHKVKKAMDETILKNNKVIKVK